MSVKNSEPRVSGEPRNAALYWLYPMLTLAVCIVFIIFRHHGSTLIPQLSVLIMCVLACGTFANLRIAIVAATLSWVTLFIAYALPGHWFKYDALGMQRLVFGFFLLYGSAIAVGRLKNKLIAAEIQLLEQRYRDYASLFNDIDVPIVECDWQRILSVNTAFCRMTGFTEAELMNLKPPYPFWPADDHARTARALESAMRGIAREFELDLVRKDGSRFPVLMYVSQIRNSKNEVARQVYSYHDLSLFKRTERELREAEKLLADSIIAADMAVIVTDGSANVAHARGHFEQLHGLAPGSFSGKLSDLDPYIPAEDRELIRKTLLDARRDRVNFEFQYRVLTPDGEKKWLRGSGRYQYDTEGNPRHALVVLQEITTLHRWLECINRAEPGACN